MRALCPNARVLAGISLGIALLHTAEAQTFQAVHAFGDNLTAINGGPYFQGRWCNGLVWPEYLAAKWNLSSQARNNHAEGSATSQVVLNQARSITGVNLDQALGVIFAGTVDFGSNVRPDTTDASWTSLSSQVLANCSNVVVTLYGKGFRSLAVLNQPDLMRFPQFSTLPEKDKAFFRQSTIQFNQALQAALSEIATAKTNLTIVTVDLFALFDVVLDQPDTYGFTETSISAIHDPRLTNKTFDGPGWRYLFWDPSSVTTRMQAMVADWVDAAWQGTSLALTRTEEGWVISAQRLLIGKTYALQASSDARVWNDLRAEQAFFLEEDLFKPALAEPRVQFFRLLYRAEPGLGSFAVGAGSGSVKATIAP